MKIYLTAGHNIVNGKGTGVHHENRDEAKEAAYFRDEVACYLEARGVEVIRDRRETTFGKVMNWLNVTLNASDTAVEFHFDAFFKHTANGCTAIVPTNPTAFEVDLGKRICNAITDTSGIVSRGNNGGVRDESYARHERIRFLHSPAKATNVLIEICFITSDSDWLKYKAHTDDIAMRVANAIYSHLKDREDAKA